MSATCSAANTTKYTAANGDLDTLLSYYNALVDTLNSGSGIGSASDRKCVKDLAGLINTKIRNNITNSSNPSTYTRLTLNKELDIEYDKLFDTQEHEDSIVLREMYKSGTFIFMIIFLILLMIYILI